MFPVIDPIIPISLTVLILIVAAIHLSNKDLSGRIKKIMVFVYASMCAVLITLYWIVFLFTREPHAPFPGW